MFEKVLSLFLITKVLIWGSSSNAVIAKLLTFVFSAIFSSTKAKFLKLCFCNPSVSFTPHARLSTRFFLAVYLKLLDLIRLTLLSLKLV